MIQAPNTQYMPMTTFGQPGYQTQGANNAVQYNQTQVPGTIYNYPATSCYLPQQPNNKSQFNGVNIEILNPQGQGLTPSNYVQMPAQFIPVQTPQVMPYYQPQTFPASQAIVQAPQAPVAQPAQTAAPAPAVPAPQIQQPATVQTPAASQTTAPQAAAPVIGQPQTTAPDAAHSPEAFAGKLRANDLNAQKNAIEEVAEAVKMDDTLAPVLLDTQIFDALIDIINKDTSSLQGPTPEILELRQKPQEELSEQDKAKATTPTPLEMAEINKQYALYTISYMQERLNNELVKRNGTALELKDLPCIENVIDTVKANPNPMLRVSAIAALSHIARPEYSSDLKTIFELAKADEDTRVQEAATKALNLLNSTPADNANTANNAAANTTQANA